MARLLVHVEGETEETFVNEILRPHLYSLGYSMVGARLIGNARQRARRGGIKPWHSVRSDIIKHLKEDAGRFITTMVDYYGMPRAGIRGWPGREAAGELPYPQRASTVEDALLADICHEMGEGFNPVRFIPFVIMHEFEGLLFSDCEAFARGIGQPGLAIDFKAIRNEFCSPEEINDSPITAPSKRVGALVPGYTKPIMGAVAVRTIGLPRIRSECPHFDDWLSRMEALPKS
ncbi:MAG: DUF4276 family protein [Syntrophobacteraceae bacterium]